MLCLYQIVEVLLESGASTSVVNRRGQTPGDVCRSPVIQELLRKGGFSFSINLYLKFIPVENYSEFKPITSVSTGCNFVILCLCLYKILQCAVSLLAFAVSSLPCTVSSLLCTVSPLPCTVSPLPCSVSPLPCSWWW